MDWHAPVVSLASPGNNTAWTAVGNLSFTYNVSDYSSISFCNLSFNGVVNQSVLSVAKDVNQSFNVSLPNGLYNWSVNCTDAEGFNGFSGVFSLTVDTIVPALNFTSPTEENGTTITRNWTQANISINEPNLDTFKFNWNGTNYSIYDDSLVLALNFNNNSAIGECFDNETEVYTDGGWKYFQDLNRSEKVLTLNQKTLEPEWQAPTAWETFDNDREMYNISLEDGSSLLVSPEHRVYGSFGVVISPSFCSSSFVSNTSTVFCFLSGWSCDQMGQQCFSDSAKYSTSSGSGVISLASFKNSFISESGAILTCSLTAKNSDRRSLSDRRVLEMISGQYFPISNSAYSGAMGVILSEKNRLCLLPLAMRSDMSTLASTTTSIFYTRPVFLSCSNLPFLILRPSSIANLSASSSESLLLDAMASAKDLLNSADLSSFNWNARSLIASNATAAQFSGNSLMSFSKSLGMFTTNSDILFTSNNIAQHVYLNNYNLMKVTEIYGKLLERAEQEYYFLTEDKKPIKVTNIEKTRYTGKIYDVDVPDDFTPVCSDLAGGVFRIFVGGGAG